MLILLVACRQPNPAFDEPGGAESSGSGLSTSGPPGTSTSSTGVTEDPTIDPSATTADASDTSDSGTSESSSSTSTGVGASSSSSGTGTDTEACDPPNMVCSGECVDTTSDRDHCGMCDEPCPGNQDCVDSRCQGGPGGD